jgi:hypothetical protein
MVLMVFFQTRTTIALSLLEPHPSDYEMLSERGSTSANIDVGDDDSI